MHYYFFAAASASLPRRFVSPESIFICSSCIISACFLSSYSFFVFFSFLCIIHVHFKKSINWVAPVVRWCFLFPFLSPDFPSSLGKSPSIKFSELGYWILNISLYSFRRNFDLSLFQEHTEVVTSLLGFVSSIFSVTRFFLFFLFLDQLQNKINCIGIIILKVFKILSSISIKIVFPLSVVIKTMLTCWMPLQLHKRKVCYVRGLSYTNIIKYLLQLYFHLIYFIYNNKSSESFHPPARRHIENAIFLFLVRGAEKAFQV